MNKFKLTVAGLALHLTGLAALAQQPLPLPDTMLALPKIQGVSIWPDPPPLRCPSPQSWIQNAVVIAPRPVPIPAPPVRPPRCTPDATCQQRHQRRVQACETAFNLCSAVYDNFDCEITRQWCVAEADQMLDNCLTRCDLVEY
jgi:hypothetical protein